MVERFSNFLIAISISDALEKDSIGAIFRSKKKI